ncbi:MAG: hypothetical protein JXA64_11350 [Candidatus Fermentibacteraceae bacterium]|nr:hypothetical protein [Candidatus Fermentibacteraceae bacterium]MBN2609701.1 hypothetical protein [Candidatus Fermentibacteraceae bacterium]
MSLVLAVLLAYAYSPADSSWSLVTLAGIPERAVLFAELAAREGGRAVVDLGGLLELSGQFDQAVTVYEVALNSAEDPLLEEWLACRITGSGPLDTLLILSTRVTNNSPATARNIRIRIPRPVPHHPYQSIEEIGGAFEGGEAEMNAFVPVLGPGATAVLPLLLHVRQEPYTYRPLSGEDITVFGGVGLEGLADMIRSIEVPLPEDGPGPCLELALALRDSAACRGLRLMVTGGLVRAKGDTLLFHAWNCVQNGSLPIDVSLFHADSMRGIAHCPTDMIPLWDLEATDGHEVSAFYSQPDVDLTVSMTAEFADPVTTAALLDLFPLFFLRGR